MHESLSCDPNPCPEDILCAGRSAEVGKCTDGLGRASRWVWLCVEGICVYVGKCLLLLWSGMKGGQVGVLKGVFPIDLFGFTPWSQLNGGIHPLLLSPLLTEDSPHSHALLGTFALTSLISANAVERLVPLSSQNFTTQSNTSTLGLSDFELRRIGVAAAVSFLGGVIQVSGTETWEWRKEDHGKKGSWCFAFIRVHVFVSIDGWRADVFYLYGNTVYYIEYSVLVE